MLLVRVGPLVTAEIRVSVCVRGFVALGSTPCGGEAGEMWEKEQMLLSGCEILSESLTMKMYSSRVSLVRSLSNFFFHSFL